MALKKFQKFYIRILFKSNMAKNINNAKIIFYNRFKTNLN